MPEPLANGRVCVEHHRDLASGGPGRTRDLRQPDADAGLHLFCTDSFSAARTTRTSRISRFQTRLHSQFLPREEEGRRRSEQGAGHAKSDRLSRALSGIGGTNYLILDLLSRGISMSKGSALVYLTKGTASALISAAAGIVVAVPAVLIHNVLRTRVERMQRELSVTVESQGHIERSFRRAQMLPLKRRFSGLPPFALLGAPTLACALMVFIGVRLSPGPAGLPSPWH